MTTNVITPAQQAVLAIVDKNGSSFVGSRTNATLNTVHVSAANALVREGVLERFLAGDGSWVRRRTIDADMLGTLANALEVLKRVSRMEYPKIVAAFPSTADLQNFQHLLGRLRTESGRAGLASCGMAEKGEVA